MECTVRNILVQRGPVEGNWCINFRLAKKKKNLMDCSGLCATSLASNLGPLGYVSLCVTPMVKKGVKCP